MTFGTSRQHFIFLAITSLVLVAAALLLPLSVLSKLVSDDAYYYMKVAANFINGFGFTFDQINPTDGFHPLWMALVIPVYWFLGDNIELSLRAVLAVQGLLAVTVVSACIAYSRKTDKPAESLAILLGVIFVLASPVLIWFNGLESALVITIITCLLYQDSNFAFLSSESSRNAQIYFGVLFGLIMLSRLDSAFLLIGLSLVMLIRDDGKRPWLLRPVRLIRNYWLSALSFLIIVSPYFIWKVYAYGHLMPISGALKATFPVPVFRFKVLIANAPYVLTMMLSGCVLILVLIQKRRDGIPPSTSEIAKQNLLVGLWTGCLLHTVWTVVFMGWGTFQWHFAYHVPIYAFILRSIVDLPLYSRLHVQKSAIYLLLLLTVVSFGTLSWVIKGDHHAARIKAAQWANENLAPDVVIGLRDAGVFGYFSRTKTVNLDGLINGYEYQEAILNGNVREYMSEKDVRYLADAYVPCEYETYVIYVQAYRGRYFSPFIQSSFYLKKASEVYLSEPSQTQAGKYDSPMCFGIWRYDASQAGFTQ